LALTVAGFGGAQVLRLASNLILARLLFPEAFGLMAIVSVIIQGLMQFSDVGVSPAIMQSKRGDDPAFLNTAWTIQALRGVGLWLVACALAWPVAVIYDAPLLMQLLPVAGLSLLITGFNPTALDTAKRHLRWGRVTAIEFAVQITGIVAAVALAWWWQSVWALVVSCSSGSFCRGPRTGWAGNGWQPRNSSISENGFSSAPSAAFSSIRPTSSSWANTSASMSSASITSASSLPPFPCSWAIC
jgi:O-antigen/teichoic acid export membrane protein